ncbi:MAG: methionyl-tRNA formyltransferase [Bacteroidia bacterium]|jgi:methionyl-tRNA formyltransferase
MDRSQMRVVFIGTPEFSVPSLDALKSAGYNIVGVITAPDRKSGRGMKLQQSAVKQYAVEHDITVLQPTNLKDKDFQLELSNLKADIQVVIAFRMLPVVVWDMPRLGTINLHASLLPNYRGSAPINWAIINGETKTGLTTFKLKHEIDTGNVLQQIELPIGPEETAGELHDKMMLEGAHLMLQTVDDIRTDKSEGVPQTPTEHHKPAPKIYKTTCEIDWDLSGAEIYNLVRGLSPYPTARTTYDSKILKIYRCTFIPENHQRFPGTHNTDGTSYLGFYCSDGLVQLRDVQLEGKRRMPVEDLLRGLRNK